MAVVSVKMKSSAVSVSRWPALAGWVRAPRSPSGGLVLNENGAAQAGVVSHTAVVTVAAITLTSRRPLGTSAGLALANNVLNLVVVRKRFMRVSYRVKGCREPGEAAP